MVLFPLSCQASEPSPYHKRLSYQNTTTNNDFRIFPLVCYLPFLQEPSYSYFQLSNDLVLFSALFLSSPVGRVIEYLPQTIHNLLLHCISAVLRPGKEKKNSIDINQNWKESAGLSHWQ